jgi:MFS family permease
MNPKKLFLMSRVALLVTAMSFALRAGAVGPWAAQFGLTNEQVGLVNSTAFWGFTLAMLFGGPLCDALGLGRIIGVAFVGHLAGILLALFAWNFWSLYIGTLIFGIANGSVEAACNPLITTLFPEDKTTKLNHFHVWFPGGIVVGGVLAYLLERMGFGWKTEFACMLIPLTVYGIGFAGQQFPKTERVQQGISYGAMLTSCLNPLFLLMVVCMLMTASTELGSTTWIPNILSAAGVPGILVLAWINGLMAVGRQGAGTIVHKLSPLGTLLVSSVFSAIGLYSMSQASGLALFAAATVFALGVCFFWPTMLGFVNERFPSTGAMGLAVMGGAGMLSVSFILPVFGKYFDEGIAHRIPSGETAQALSSAPNGSPLAAQWLRIQASAGLEMLGRVGWLPVILFVIFLALFLTRSKAKVSQPGSIEPHPQENRPGLA